MISSGPAAELGDAAFPSGLAEERAQDRSLGNGFPALLWEQELRDFMALVLLERLFYRESGCSFAEQGIQCLSSELKSIWEWEIIPWSP